MRLWAFSVILGTLAAIESQAEACSLAGPHATLWSVPMVSSAGSLWFTRGPWPDTEPPIVQLSDESGKRSLQLVPSDIELDSLYTQPGLLTVWRVPLEGILGSSVQVTFPETPTATTSVIFPISNELVEIEAPKVVLALTATGEPEEPISSCSADLANEVAIAFVSWPAHADWLEAVAEYSDGSSSTRRWISPQQDRFTFWTTDKGVPCVTVVAKNARGAVSALARACEAIGCTTNRSSPGVSGREVEYRMLGGASCEQLVDSGVISTASGERSDGCSCSSARGSGSSLLALLVAISAVRRGLFQPRK